MSYRLFLLASLVFGPGSVWAGDIMFEGYYAIKLDGKAIGYNVERYEFDAKARTFETVSFLRAKVGDKIVQESLKARSNDKFQPIAYQYTSQNGDEVKTIDATFKGDIMKAAISDGKKVRNETSKIPKGTFLASFLTYIMLQKKLAPNEVFKYSGVAEETGGSYWGKAWIESKTKQDQFTILRVLNTFTGEKFVANIAVIPDPANPDHYIKGEILSTESTTKGITTVLVPNAGQATEGQMVPNKVLVTLFGNMPTGKMNMISNPPTQEKAPPQPPPTTNPPPAKEK